MLLHRLVWLAAVSILYFFAHVVHLNTAVHLLRLQSFFAASYFAIASGERFGCFVAGTSILLCDLVAQDGERGALEPGCF